MAKELFRPTYSPTGWIIDKLVAAALMTIFVGLPVFLLARTAIREHRPIDRAPKFYAECLSLVSEMTVASPVSDDQQGQMIQSCMLHMKNKGD